MTEHISEHIQLPKTLKGDKQGISRPVPSQSIEQFETCGFLLGGDGNDRLEGFLSLFKVFFDISKFIYFKTTT